ncbi:MAG: energy transducer TonB [Methylovulum sp.]|uniref:energy transducer TonB family protein n=1 Tax=Methylovulum sp. TaxID=1916980 RepID=UPI002623E743|nr:energy transducer TonB [Methylovulum sp.]MDD2722614.1 energy transducer TonB [Methylovulum sp.]MDD5123788.1 energy transducer TonB [Methylovulum sp.]
MADMTPDDSIWDRWLRQAIIRVVAVLIIAGIVFFVRRQILSAGYQRVEAPLSVTLLKDQPPVPPPPPPKEILEQPAEEPKTESMESEALEVESNPEVLDETLGLDTATAVAGSDAFGLKARKGGKSLTEIKPESGLKKSKPSTMELGFYASKIEEYLQNELSKRNELRSINYSVIIKIWLDDEGRITRCDLGESTGNKNIDSLLVGTLTGSRKIPNAPPKNMPQPVILRITTQGIN